MKKYQLAAAISLPLITAATAHCGARGNLDDLDETGIVDFQDGGSDASPDAQLDAGTDANNTPDADSSVPPVQYITRGQLARTLKEEILYYPDFQESCKPAFPDIQADTPLCRATNFLSEKNFMKGYPDGTFGPDKNVNHAELWKAASTGLQFTQFVAPCVNNYSDIPSDSWFAYAAGALCEKGISLSTTSEAHPADLTTIQELTKLKTEAIAYLSQPLDDQTIVELVGHTILEQSPNSTQDVSNCLSQYASVPNSSLTCFYSNYLIGQGLLSPTSSFAPFQQVNNAEMTKLYVLALQLPIALSGCSGEDPNQWYTAYLDTLCDAGWIDQGFDPIAVNSRWVGSQLAWDTAWEKKQMP